MARKKAVKRRIRNNKGGGFYLPRTTPDPDSLFTMVLSAHKFFDDSFSASGLKIDSKILLKNIMSAIEKTFEHKSAKTNKPEYNVAADALAAAYIAHSSGDKANSRKMVKLAFMSPDCEKLMDSLAALNTEAEGSMPLLSEIDDDYGPSNDSGDPPSMPPINKSYNTNLETQITAPMENVEDISGGSSDSDENHGGENSPSDDREMKASRKKFIKRLRKIVRSNRESFVDDNGDLLENEFIPRDYAMTLKNGKKPALPAPIDANNDSYTMSDNDADMDSIEPSMNGGELQDVSLLTSEELKALAKSNPKIVAIANKISALGDKKSKKLAVKFISRYKDCAA
jgi:hypothetical protein